jgi:hypothetical protein
MTDQRDWQTYRHGNPEGALEGWRDIESLVIACTDHVAERSTPGSLWLIDKASSTVLDGEIHRNRRNGPYGSSNGSGCEKA